MDSVHIKGRISRELGIIYVFFCSKKEILFHKLKGKVMMNSSSINKKLISAIEREFENWNICLFQDVKT